tara:strand:+ start:372 stop:701 length:330 start_codon:yes stop_codon:yes gene_type:complete
MVLKIVAIFVYSIGAVFQALADGFFSAASTIDKKMERNKFANVVEELTDESQSEVIPTIPPEGYSEILPGDFEAYYREQLRLRSISPDDPRIDPEFDEIKRRVGGVRLP